MVIETKSLAGWIWLSSWLLVAEILVRSGLTGRDIGFRFSLAGRVR